METKAAFDIAKEVVKPTSSLIDALIAPKVAAVRKWAAERDVQARAIAVKLDPEVAFGSYLNRLFRSVAMARTILFQQSLPLPDIYEPISVKDSLTFEGRDEEYIIRDGARACIVDGAGMGKSTFVKMLVLNELLNGERVPLFLELRRVEQGQSVIEAIAKSLDELHRPFDRELLRILLSDGCFFIVLDGFDEVAEDQRKHMAEQIEDLAGKSSNSTIVLTSRPNVSLPQVPGCAYLQFEELSQEQAESIIRRYDYVIVLQVGDSLIPELNKVPDQFVRTPLLVTLLYRTYAYRNAISTRLYTFYDDIYDAFYMGHDLTKAGFSREKNSTLDSADFRRLLRGFAFLALVSAKGYIESYHSAVALVEQATRLTSIKPKSCTDFVGDLLLAVPLLTRDGTEIKFIHRTLMEFFAAEFFAFDSNGRGVLDKLIDKRGLHEYPGVMKFLKDISPVQFRQSVTSRLAKSLVQTGGVEDCFVKTMGYIRFFFVLVAPLDEFSLSLKEGLPSKLAANSSLYVFPGKVGEKDYVVAIEAGPIDATTALCWESLSSPIAFEPLTRQKTDSMLYEDLSELVAKISTMEWIDVMDERVIDDPIVRRAAYSSLIGVLSQHDVSFHSERNTVRLLDDKEILRTLHSIEEESNIVGWVDELLGDSNTVTTLAS